VNFFQDQPVKSDEEILRKISEGQTTLSEAIDALAYKYQDTIFRACWKWLPTHPKEEIEQVTQDVFETAYILMLKQEFNVKREPESIVFGLLAIARNKCRDFKKKKSRKVEVPDDDLLQTMSESNSRATRKGKEDSDDWLDKVRRACMQLSEREIITLSAIESGMLTREQLAQRRGVQPETIRKEFNEIIKKLKKIVEGGDIRDVP